MNIHALTLYGQGMSSNCYILNNGEKAVVIDPGFEDNNLFDFLRNKKLNVEMIVLTHGHFDHWGGLKKLQSLYPNAKTYASSIDDIWYKVGPNNRYNYEPLFDYDLNKLNEINFLGEKYKVIKVPGHSSGSVAFYNNKTLISGDVLFFRGIGRYDLPEGDYDTLISSIKKLYTLPNETTVYSGHGRQTTIGFEKEFNPFIRG
ncbi:MBL fold metallo-hydrolase [Haploplasma axanthum]|uniref:Hydroxyacylglutathione hydrolase n=1 Tax=Haploplasma axanthum TaxID=29552 RepID=A0A449BF15_HAPAX|nr:MBL fold metallo-hydrolase [Haploplasma axanthum]VEU81015.1 hydroxyacylglutathione hydrolase [Haploplasma axanthum]